MDGNRRDFLRLGAALTFTLATERSWAQSKVEVSPGDKLTF